MSTSIGYGEALTYLLMSVLIVHNNGQTISMRLRSMNLLKCHMVIYDFLLGLYSSIGKIIHSFYDYEASSDIETKKAFFCFIVSS